MIKPFFIHRGKMNVKKSLQDIDDWLETFKTSFLISNVQWTCSEIANDVFDKEATLRFDSHEERLLFRIETWLDMCQGEGTFKHASRKNRVSKTRKLAKRTNSMKSPAEMRKLQSSMSFDSLPSSETEEKYNSLMQGINYSKSASKTLNSSYSTTDLSTRLHETVISDIVLTNSSSESSFDDMEVQPPPKQSLFGSLRMRLFSFGRTQTPAENISKSQADISHGKSKRRSKTAPARKHKKRKSLQDDKYVTDLDKDEEMDRNTEHVNHGRFLSDDVHRNNVCSDDIQDERSHSYDVNTLTNQLYDDDGLTLRRIPKSRPSLFGVREFVQSAAEVSPEELLNQEPLSKSLDHIDMRALKRKDVKFKTLAGVRKDMFSRGELNDSLRRFHTQRGRKLTGDRLSLDMTKNEADLGFI